MAKLNFKDPKKNGITTRALLPCVKCKSATFHTYVGHRKTSPDSFEEEVIMECEVCVKHRVWGIEDTGKGKWTLQ